MIRAKYEDKDLVAGLLAEAFVTNSSVNYVIRQDDKKEFRIYALMAYSFEVCLLFGEVWLSNDRRACVLILYPHHKRLTLQSLWLDIKLIFYCVGLKGLVKTLKREAIIKEKQPKEAKCYIWFIGVLPNYQHKGTGSRLLQQVILRAHEKNLPLYLETSALSNLKWYERLGFEIYDTLEMDYTLFFMKRKSAM